jgi:hypothetical protein
VCSNKPVVETSLGSVFAGQTSPLKKTQTNAVKKKWHSKKLQQTFEVRNTNLFSISGVNRLVKNLLGVRICISCSMPGGKWNDGTHGSDYI